MTSEEAWETFGMYAAVGKFVDKVSAFSKGKTDCFALWMLAKKSTKALNTLIGTNTDLYKCFVKTKLEWPYVASPISLACEEMAAFFKKIGLGEEPEIPVDPKKFNRTTGVIRKWVSKALFEITQSILMKRVVIDNIDKIIETPEYKPKGSLQNQGVNEGTCREYPSTKDVLKAFKFMVKNPDRYCKVMYEEAPLLPEPTVANAGQWFPVVWAWIEMETKDDPAGCAELRAEGFSRGISQEGLPSGVSEPDLRTGKIRGPIKFENAIRNEIRARVKQTLPHLLKK